jgi:hypothetical protein
MKAFLNNLKQRLAKSKTVNAISKNEAVRICLAVTSLVLVTLLTGPMTETSNVGLVPSNPNKSIELKDLNLVPMNPQAKINADDISNGFAIERPESDTLDSKKNKAPKKNKIRKPISNKKTKAIVETKKSRLGRFFAFLKKDEIKTKKSKKSQTAPAKKT